MSLLLPIVTVPAKDEEDHLPTFFASLAAQSWLAQSSEPLRVVIVLNNCADGSRRVVERAMEAYPRLSIQLIDVTLDKPHAHVGTARKMAMDAALAAGDPERTAILTTDADSTPRCDWVTNNLRHLADGIDLVCGVAWLNKSEYEQMDKQVARRAERHWDFAKAVDHLTALLNPTPHDPWPRHTDHTGQSLAIKATVYRDIGGLPALPCGEDQALVERVKENGYIIRHPCDVVVETSARLVGRAAGGMAAALQERSQDASAEKPQLVTHPLAIFHKLTGADMAMNTLGLVSIEEGLVIVKDLIAQVTSSSNTLLHAA